MRTTGWMIALTASCGLLLLNEICDVHWHFDNAGLVELFQFFQNTHVLIRNKVDCDSFATKTTASTDAVIEETIKFEARGDDHEKMHLEKYH